MYSVLPSFIIGFHGCDKSVAEEIFAGKTTLRPSANDYDWLGNGIYFWENNHHRAMEYAELIEANPERCKEKIKTPAVVGAIIDLGHCLNLLDTRFLQHIKKTYKILQKMGSDFDMDLPRNKTVGEGKDLLLRHLDCAVIEMTHLAQKGLADEKKGDYEFDSVRAVYTEGKDLYENAGFSEKNHIQVCIRNPNCIKGYFRVIKSNPQYRIP